MARTAGIRGERVRTAGVPAADRPIARALRVAANVSDPRIDKALVAAGGEFAPKHMLDTPEAAGGDGGRLRAGRDVHGGGVGHHGERSDKAGEKGHER